jgi:phage shock protein PspC (stress-responsive transcriptional regulator)
MNEITRIHIAKVAYDIEINAKKQLEKYIKSLDTYANDSEVLADIEIRITELLAERKVVAGAVIGTDDVAAVRKQLGEPYEFAHEDGDIAVGALETADTDRRLFRSQDDAVLGGVLSGLAAYFNVNPLWTRLIFLLVVFISAGVGAIAYLIFWIILPPAKTAAQKLQLAGIPVTVDSIRELNIRADSNQSRAVAPVVKRVLGIGLGIASIFAALTVLGLLVFGIFGFSFHGGMESIIDSITASGFEDTWVAWLVFWAVIVGLLLLTALFSILAYALMARKFTKRIIISGIVIIVLGVTAATVAIGVTASQSWRVSSEAQAMVKTSKLNLPAEFSGVTSVVFSSPTNARDAQYFNAVNSVQYVAEQGTPRYELSALPKVKVNVKIENQTAYISLDIPNDFRNNYVQPSLTIYGPALISIQSEGVNSNYSNAASQDVLNVSLSKSFADFTVSGTYNAVSVSGVGSVDLSSSAVQSLEVRSNQELSVIAGTVKNLVVSQPEVCASRTYNSPNRVTVSGVTSGMMTYNDKEVAAKTVQSNCATVIVGDDDGTDDAYDNRYNR